MGLWTMVFLMFLTLLVAIGYTIILAMQGSIIAVIILSFLAFVVLFAIFQGFHLAFTIIRDRQERIRAQDDLKEDMAMMQQMFRVQASQAQAQNQFLIGQSKQQKLIPAKVDMGNLFDDFETEDDYAD